MKTAVFTSSDVVYARHNGETVRVLQELTADEASDPTGGQMYRIRFQDGTEAEAYADELKKMKSSKKRSVSLSVDQATAMIAAVRKMAENCGGKVPEGVDAIGYLSAVGLIADAFFLRKLGGGGMNSRGELDGALLAARCLPIAMLKTGDAGEVVEMRHQPADRLWPNALIPLYLAPTFTDGEVAAIKDCAALASAQGGECFKRAAATLLGLLDRAVDPGT